jgi:hypothetical protein
MLLLATAAEPGSAQSQIGRIDRMAEVRRAGNPVKIQTPSPNVQIGRGGDAWSLAQPNQELLERDQLRVARFFDVRIQVRRPTHRGSLIFTPEILSENLARVFQVDQVPARAEYDIPGDTAGSGELAVRIRSGALVIDWDAGRLVVIAAGHPAVVVGTRAAFVMDSAGTAGWLYVDEGTISLPAANVTVNAGQLVRLQLGLPPIVTAVQAAQQPPYQDATRYHAQQVWSRFTPFWAKPSFFIPAIGLVAGGAVFAATQAGGDDGGRPRGTVIIRIPF